MRDNGGAVTPVMKHVADAGFYVQEKWVMKPVGGDAVAPGPRTNPTLVKDSWDSNIQA